VVEQYALQLAFPRCFTHSGLALAEVDSGTRRSPSGPVTEHQQHRVGAVAASQFWAENGGYWLRPNAEFLCTTLQLSGAGPGPSPCERCDEMRVEFASWRLSGVTARDILAPTSYSAMLQGLF